MNRTKCFEPRIGTRKLSLLLPESVQEASVGTTATEIPIQTLINKILDEPIEFPPLPLALLDDDHIAIAIEDGVPEANSIACALVRYLVDHGTRQEMIAIVLGSDNQEWRERLLSELKDHSFDEVRVVKHEPANREAHGYIAASESADAIYIQRDLFEAEVVLPVYCIRTPESPSASDKYGMSPGFADAATQHRWNLAWLDDNEKHMHLQEKLSHEAGWLMGVQFALAVVPSQDGSIGTILAGAPDHIFKQACAMVHAEDFLTSETYDLVIAFVEGDWTQQSWMNVARAAAHADLQLKTEGSIVVCTDIKNMTQGIQQLGDDEEDEKLERSLLKSDLEDAFAAAVIHSIKNRRSIYLMSQLTTQQVESLGLAYIDSPIDIEKLCESVESVRVIRSAQF